MYWTPLSQNRSDFKPIWATSLPQALNLIKEAVQGERNDELFYDEIIKLAPTSEQASIITSIRDDERGHNFMFRGCSKKLQGKISLGLAVSNINGSVPMKKD